MTTPATDTEATVICQHVASWTLHTFATKPAQAIRDERTHGTASGGWITNSTSKGISYKHTARYDSPTSETGLVSWARVTELIRAAAAADVIAELGAAIEAKRALDFQRTQETWARQHGEPSPITDRDAHEDESLRLLRLIHERGGQIKGQIRNPYPLGQLDMFDLIGAGA